MPSLRIPLFPLNLVLLPGNKLPLHIFEPRYKKMIRDSMDHRTPFGIVLAKETGIARVGCTAEVIHLLKTYDDGRMDIETVGLFPFRIDDVHQENPLLEATVESLEDDLEDDPYGAAELLELFTRCYTLVRGERPAPLNSVAGVSLVYQVAGRLPIHHDVLQELLEIRAETARRARLTQFLRDFIPQVSNMRYRQSKAGTNGAGSNGHSRP